LLIIWKTMDASITETRSSLVSATQHILVRALTARTAEHFWSSFRWFVQPWYKKVTLFSDHIRSLLGRQPGAMTISHSPKGKED